MKQLFVYKAKVAKVIDGDTVDFTVDLGFNAYQAIRTRLLGINAPELSTMEGKTTKILVQRLLPVGSEVIIETHKTPGDKYGRWLAIVHVYTEDANVMHNLNQLLITEGYALEFIA